MKTKHDIDRKYGIAYCRILKIKVLGKVANRKLVDLVNLKNLGTIFPSFLISKFSILPYTQNRKLGLKNLRKKILEISNISEFSEFSTWPVSSLLFNCSEVKIHRLLQLKYQSLFQFLGSIKLSSVLNKWARIFITFKYYHFNSKQIYKFNYKQILISNCLQICFKFVKL